MSARKPTLREQHQARIHQLELHVERLEAITREQRQKIARLERQRQAAIVTLGLETPDP